MTLFLRFWASVKRLFSSISVDYLSYTCQLGGGSYHYEVLAREKDGATRLMTASGGDSASSFFDEGCG